MPQLPRLENAQVAAKRVLIRLPTINQTWLDAAGQVNATIFYTIKASVDLILQRGGRVLLLAEQNSNAPAKLDAAMQQNIAAYAGNFFKRSVELLETATQSAKLASSHITLLLDWPHNKQSATAKYLASLCDVYVNEGRSANRQAHPIFHELAQLVPACMGMGLHREREFFTNLLAKLRPEAHLVLGGVNLQAKLDFIKKLQPHLQALLIGGSLAYTFLYSRALPVGRSLYEDSLGITAFQLLERADLEQIQTLLPCDHLLAQSLSATSRTKRSSAITDDWMAVDIGSKSCSQFEKALHKASTIIWYGPLGVNEVAKFNHSNMRLARLLSKSKARVCVIGQDTCSLSICAATKANRHDLILIPDSSFAADLFCKRSLPGCDI